MSQPRDKRNSKILWGLILLAIVARLIFYIWPRITGSPEVDGLLAVSLGFYIYSRAAANFLTVILYELGARRWASLTRSVITWLGLNALVMLSGLMLVIMGVYRFFYPGVLKKLMREFITEGLVSVILFTHSFSVV